jgi:hypothetical protein
MVTTESSVAAAQDVPLQGEQPAADADIELIPMQRSGLSNTRALRFSDQELARVAMLQEWLSITDDPETGKPFIAENTFSALVIFTLNMCFTTMMNFTKELAAAQEA